MSFDVEAAQKAGYTPAEIADYLGSQSKFDVAGARKAGYSDADIISHLSGGTQKDATPEIAWSDVPGKALSNLPSSAGNFVSGLYQTVRHPVDTAMSVLDMAAGGLRNATPNVISSLIDKVDPNPQAAQRATTTANAVGQFYKDRYGSVAGVKNALATDPVGVAADASTVLGLGGALAGENAVGNALNVASKYTNPLTPIVAGVKGAAKVAGFVGKQGLGLSSGVGAENVSNAFKAGLEGDTNFTKNMRGEVPMSDVLDKAKENLLNMKQQKSALYRSGMVDISKDATQLDFGGIDKAVSEAQKMGTYKGKVTNPAAAAKVNEMSQAVENWLRLDPKQFHTPEGFDALKQQLGGILETIPYEQKTARLAGGKIYNAIKDTITQQAPKYAEVMKNYSEASDLIGEIEKTLSLKPGASVDTALRKLQSLTRNNVSTNYGNRLDLANKLQEAGGNNLMPAISGQAMGSWTPRGLTTLAPTAEAVAALMGHPWALAALPFQSPRLIGEAVYGAGRAAAPVLNASVPLSPEAARLTALLGQRAGALYQPQ